MPTIPQGRVSAASPPHRSPLARGGGGETKTASFQILEPRAYSQQWPRTRAPSPDRPERVALHEKLQASASPAWATEPSVEVGERREPWRRIGTWCASWIRQGFGNSHSDGLSIKQGGRTAIPSNTLLETSSTMRGRDSRGRQSQVVPVPCLERVHACILQCRRHFREHPRASCCRGRSGSVRERGRCWRCGREHVA